MRLLNQILSYFKTASEEERLYKFLSQATDRVHLEYLQRQWDNMSYRDKAGW